ncbi:hypothetical protein P0Y35_04935 [Kiritimatiellaeota bacterium B1221]|nr:hypothetical protein [Kiritimatiellaeota bacterium B1221]
MQFKRPTSKLFLLCGFCLLGSGGGWSFADEAGDADRWSVSGRVRSVSMTRDYEAKGLGSNSSLGLLLHATGEISDGIEVGGTYIYAEEVYAAHQSNLLSNNDFHLLNEAWMIFRPAEGMAVEAGRFISNGEVFRKDDSRQKPRAIEGVQVMSPSFTLGHAFEMSNYLQSADRWKFNDFEKVFGVDAESDGVTWLEYRWSALENLQIDLYDAFAWDITNLVGSHVQWSFSESASLSLYVRAENGVEENRDHASETYGLSLHQKVGSFQLEPGLLSVQGDKMLFQETTTGFHHALASSMIIYTCPFDGGATSFYLKATRKWRQTGIYILGIYTEQSELPFNGGELNLILRQPLSDQWELVCKSGVGYRDNEEGPGTRATDLRFFVTYEF